MRNFNKVRRMQIGGAAISNLNPYNNGSFEAAAISLPDQIAQLDPSSMPTLTDTAIEQISNFNRSQNRKNAGLKLKGQFKDAGQNIKNALAGKGGGNSAAFGMLQQGFGLANSYMNKDLVNSEGFDKFNQMADGVVGALGAINPAWGAIAGAVQTGINGINLLGATKSDSFSVDTQTQAQIGGGYRGSYSDMNEAAQKAGKKYGLFNRKGFKEASEDIAEARKMDSSLQNINQENQTRLAMAANTQMNAMNYANKLNGGIDFNSISIGKTGLKLELIDRIKNIKHRVNVNTKQIEEEKVGETTIFRDGGIIEFEPNIKVYSSTDILDDVIEFIPSISSYKEGGSIKESEELVKLEETNQKNVIPEGALHKNKHHIEHSEGLTQKGIPVIDNDGEQQAEIELDEIIFTLEVTKKLEELYKLYKEGSNKERDEAAIEAGKLLVQEILYNTDDRTGLIAKCQKGGKL